MDLFWILDEDGEPVRCPDVIDWARWFENVEGRRIGRTEVNGFTVFTSFLGIDRSCGVGPPMLYETMVESVNGWLDYQERYATRAEAIAGHTRAIDWVLAGCATS